MIYDNDPLHDKHKTIARDEQRTNCQSWSCLITSFLSFDFPNLLIQLQTETEKVVQQYLPKDTINSMLTNKKWPINKHQC